MTAFFDVTGILRLGQYDSQYQKDVFPKRKLHTAGTELQKHTGELIRLSKNDIIFCDVFLTISMLL